MKRKTTETVVFSEMVLGRILMSKDSVRLIANNKKAYHDYFIEDTYEAGIVLVGTEVKIQRCSS